MTDNKKYYYLKLEETYFNQKIEKALRLLPSGAEMLICYLKMQLRYLQSEGFIIYSGIYDTIEAEIALEVDEDAQIVQMTLAALIKWGYVTEVKNGLYIKDVQKRIGSKTDVAMRVAKHRKKIKTLQCNKKVTQYRDRVKEEIEIDTETDNSDGKPSGAEIISIYTELLKSNDIVYIPATKEYPTFHNGYKKYIKAGVSHEDIKKAMQIWFDKKIGAWCGYKLSIFWIDIGKIQIDGQGKKGIGSTIKELKKEMQDE